jgi:hypothetical protein
MKMDEVAGLVGTFTEKNMHHVEDIEVVGSIGLFNHLKNGSPASPSIPAIIETWVLNGEFTQIQTKNTVFRCLQTIEYYRIL